MRPVQYKRATLRPLRNVLTYTRSKLSAAQRRYKNSFNHKVSFRPVVNKEDFACVDGPPPVLTEAGMRNLEHLHGNNTDTSRKLLWNSGGPYRVRSATDTFFYIVRDGVTTNVSADPVTKVKTGPRAAHSSVATAGETKSKAAITEVATGVCATEQNSIGNGSVKADDLEYVIEKHFGHNRTETGRLYPARCYGYNPSEDTNEHAELLPQPFVDRYWREIQKKRPYSDRLRRS